MMKEKDGKVSVITVRVN